GAQSCRAGRRGAEVGRGRARRERECRRRELEGDAALLEAARDGVEAGDRFAAHRSTSAGRVLAVRHVARRLPLMVTVTLKRKASSAGSGVKRVGIRRLGKRRGPGRNTGPTT